MLRLFERPLGYLKFPRIPPHVASSRLRHFIIEYFHIAYMTFHY